ncbi:MAG TPA: hypothetical protein VH370_20845 [Humisphaera sp.]|nr:hypothetical protein [Humisphaera sp.]
MSIEPGAPFSNAFVDTKRITLPAKDGIEPTLEVVVGDRANVESYFDDASGCCVYRWGIAAHPDVRKSELLKWIADVINRGDFSALCQLVGMFVILIDDRRHRRVRMVSDPLGFRPWHVGTAKGKLVCGSDVWLLQRAGFDMGGVNYDAVAAWLRCIFDLTERGLFNGFPPIGYGVVATWEAGKYSESRYWNLAGVQRTPPDDELIEGMHQRISRTFDALTCDLDRVSIALSGGYDSRYVAGLAAKSEHLKTESFCIVDRESEEVGATNVVKALNLPMFKVLKTDGTLWDMYAAPFSFTPAGFPITKQLSYVAAAQRPGVPCLTGFFGDPMNRGSLDRVGGKLERETQEDLAVAYHRAFASSHLLARFDLLDPQVTKRGDERIISVLRKRFADWADSGHAILGVNLVAQQRHFMSNNVLQHLHVAEAITPFYSWETIQYKMGIDAACFSYDLYRKLLDRFYPQMSKIPHNSALADKNVRQIKPSRWTKRWATTVLKDLARPGRLSLLSHRKAAPRLLGTLIGRREMDVVAMFLYRLHLLEDRLRRAEVQFDWREM